MSAQPDARRMTTPMSRVIGLGSAKDGVEHWWAQRLTSIALIPLTLLFVIPFAATVGEGFDAMRALYGHPFHAIVAILFLAVAFHHNRQGLQVVIEDYVHGKGARTTLLVLNALLNGLFAAIAIFAIAKIAFTA